MVNVRASTLTPKTPNSARIDRRCASGGFTMIELLVTIAVIAVLLGISAPALQSVRRNSTSAQCRARLASIGLMHAAYASEHKDMYPTFEYPVDASGVADPILAPEWGVGGGGWLVLPISEIWFWGYQLRPYAAEDPETEVMRTVEALSCPVVHNEWITSLPPEQLEGDVRDPMRPIQNSYVRSTALFTRASAWNDPSAPPDVNAAHAPVRIAEVSFPSSKAVLVEASSHHSRSRARLESAGVEQVNILAADGHVERRRVIDAMTPMGFVGASTGFEQPQIEPDRWIDTGLPYVSTRAGHLGRDW